MKEPVMKIKIEERILFLRGYRVLLSTHLAEFYGVKPKILIQTVKRNLERFPGDFMFQLSKEEDSALRSQIVTLDEQTAGET